MSKTSFVWAGGEHSFFLGIGELRALQNHCDAGPMHIFTRLSGFEWRVDDVYQTIRLGLVGGGADEKDARKLVDTFIVEPAAFYKHVILAANILRISVMGDADDEVGSDMAGEPIAGETTNSLAENTSGQDSTVQG